MGARAAAAIAETAPGRTPFAAGAATAGAGAAWTLGEACTPNDVRDGADRLGIRTEADNVNAGAAREAAEIEPFPICGSTGPV